MEDERTRSSGADAIDAGLEVADAADVAGSTAFDVVDVVATDGDIAEVGGTVLEVMISVLGGIFEGL